MENMSFQKEREQMKIELEKQTKEVNSELKICKIETPNIKLELEDCCEEAVKCVETFAAIMYGIEKQKE